MNPPRGDNIPSWVPYIFQYIPSNMIWIGKVNISSSKFIISGYVTFSVIDTSYVENLICLYCQTFQRRINGDAYMRGIVNSFLLSKKLSNILCA